MAKKIKVGVIFGGRSGEHEVSIVSAQSVIKALDKKKYEVIPIGITKSGQWLAGRQAAAFLKAGTKKVPVTSTLLADPTQRGMISFRDRRPAGIKGLDVVFPVLHGPYGEDGTIQGLFELANIPYVGAGVLGSAVGMDKVVQKQLFAQAGLPIVRYVWFLGTQWRQQRSRLIGEIERQLGYPVFTKPVNLGSSVGIGKCHNRQELIRGVVDALRYDRKVIVEQGIGEIHEIEVAVLGNDQPKASVPGEIISSNEFYDYDAKYVDGQSQAIIPAKLPPAVIKKIQAIALGAFQILDLSGMSRVDFFVTKRGHTIYLNEVNTIPGFTSISMYPQLWAASGLPYPKLLDELIDLALERHREKNRLATGYQPKQAWYK